MLKFNLSVVMKAQRCLAYAVLSYEASALLDLNTLVVTSTVSIASIHIMLLKCMILRCIGGISLLRYLLS